MTMVTVFADASHCPLTKAAGWGAWAKGDGWDHGLTFGGEIKAVVLNAAEAEMAAMANALARLRNQERLQGLHRIMLQSDCLRVLQLILQAIPRSESSNHKNGAPVESMNLAMSPMERRGVEIIEDVLADCKGILLRHVKGHRRGGGRQWVNRACDVIAFRHMSAQRARREADAARTKDAISRRNDAISNGSPKFTPSMEKVAS